LTLTSITSPSIDANTEPAALSWYNLAEQTSEMKTVQFSSLRDCRSSTGRETSQKVKMTAGNDSRHTRCLTRICCYTKIVKVNLGSVGLEFGKQKENTLLEKKHKKNLIL
uniref:Uncharacterized protein n=1 Tax=Takifugu rubripes TaxID=31033 RepID=A0A3B5KDZ6_TAKRU